MSLLSELSTFSNYTLSNLVILIIYCFITWQRKLSQFITLLIQWTFGAENSTHSQCLMEWTLNSEWANFTSGYLELFLCQSTKGKGAS